MGARVADRLDQLVDDLLRRRAVRIAHAEVDDVLAGGPRRRLHRVDLAEHVGRQAADPVELGLPHRISASRVMTAGMRTGRSPDARRRRCRAGSARPRPGEQQTGLIAASRSEPASSRDRPPGRRGRPGASPTARARSSASAGGVGLAEDPDHGPLRLGAAPAPARAARRRPAGSAADCGAKTMRPGERRSPRPRSAPADWAGRSRPAVALAGGGGMVARRCGRPRRARVAVARPPAAASIATPSAPIAMPRAARLSRRGRLRRRAAQRPRAGCIAGTAGDRRRRAALRPRPEQAAQPVQQSRRSASSAGVGSARSVGHADLVRLLLRRITGKLVDEAVERVLVLVVAQSRSPRPPSSSKGGGVAGTAGASTAGTGSAGSTGPSVSTAATARGGSGGGGRLLWPVR